MKNLKFGFLSIIALVALSFTVASFKGAFNIKKVSPKAVPNCYSLQQGTFNTGLPTCTFAAPTTCASAIVGRPVQSLTDQSTNELCNTGSVNFCCADLEESTTQQCNEAQVTFTDYTGASKVNKYAKIKTVYCKP